MYAFFSSIDSVSCLMIMSFICSDPSSYFLNSSFFDSAACKTQNCRIRTLNSRRRRMPNDGHKELTIRHSSAKTADVNTCTGQTLAAFEQYMKRGQVSRCCDETAMWLPPLRRCRRRVVCFPAFAAGRAVPMAAQAHAAVEGGEDAFLRTSHFSLIYSKFSQLLLYST